MYHANSSQKKAQVDIVISGKINFRAKNITRVIKEVIL